MITTIENNQIRVKISAKGAELQSLYDLRKGEERLWQADPSIWGKRAPVLFPVVGTLKDGCYKHEDNWYKIGRHGFARDCEFKLVEQTEETAVFELSADEKSLNIYPFDFRFRIHYGIKGTALTVKYEIKNCGDGEMYFSVGAHPGFFCNLESGKSYLKITGDLRETHELLCVSTDTGLITPAIKTLNTPDATIWLSKPLFDEDALVLKGDGITGFVMGDERGDTLKFNCANYPYIGIWSPKGPFICLEPWHGIADFENSNQVLAHKHAIRKLSGNEMFDCDYSIEIL